MLLEIRQGLGVLVVVGHWDELGSSKPPGYGFIGFRVLYGVPVSERCLMGCTGFSLMLIGTLFGVLVLLNSAASTPSDPHCSSLAQPR